MWRGRIPIYLCLCFAILTIIHAGSNSWADFIFQKLSWLALLIGMLGFGILSSWLFGFEYQNQTFKDLLALPISRSKLVISKLLALLISETMILFVLICWIFLMGNILQMRISLQPTSLAFRYFIPAVLCTLGLNLFYPLIASVSHGLLVPISFDFASLIFGRIIAEESFGRYFPWAGPFISIQHGTSTSFWSWSSVFMVSVIGIIGTILWWNQVDQKD
ncbi:hypothetical protein FCS83_09350 [Oenococcus sp. UCMA 17063]|nr:hypothetical protein [Oenococcus sp. UCMA 17063]